MTGYTWWRDVRAEHVARPGGEQVVAAGKQELLNELIGHRLAEVRRARDLTQQDVADRMGVTKGQSPRGARVDRSGWPAQDESR